MTWFVTKSNDWDDRPGAMTIVAQADIPWTIRLDDALPIIVDEHLGSGKIAPIKTPLSDLVEYVAIARFHNERERIAYRAQSRDANVEGEIKQRFIGGRR